jgi:hypothetical protein
MRGESAEIAVVFMVSNALNYGLQPSKKDHHPNAALDYGLQPSITTTTGHHSNITTYMYARSHADMGNSVGRLDWQSNSNRRHSRKAKGELLKGAEGRITLRAATEASLTMTLASLRPAQMISIKLRTCTLKTAGAFSAISRRMSTAA